MRTAERMLDDLLTEFVNNMRAHDLHIRALVETLDEEQKARFFAILERLAAEAGCNAITGKRV